MPLRSATTNVAFASSLLPACGDVQYEVHVGHIRLRGGLFEDLRDALGYLGVARRRTVAFEVPDSVFE